MLHFTENRRNVGTARWTIFLLEKVEKVKNMQHNPQYRDHRQNTDSSSLRGGINSVYSLVILSQCYVHSSSNPGVPLVSVYHRDLNVWKMKGYSFMLVCNFSFFVWSLKEMRGNRKLALYVPIQKIQNSMYEWFWLKERKRLCSKMVFMDTS